MVARRAAVEPLNDGAYIAKDAGVHKSWKALKENKLEDILWSNIWEPKSSEKFKQF